MSLAGCAGQVVPDWGSVVSVSQPVAPAVEPVPVPVERPQASGRAFEGSSVGIGQKYGISEGANRTDLRAVVDGLRFTNVPLDQVVKAVAKEFLHEDVIAQGAFPKVTIEFDHSMTVDAVMSMVGWLLYNNGVTMTEEDGALALYGAAGGSGGEDVAVSGRAYRTIKVTHRKPFELQALAAALGGQGQAPPVSPGSAGGGGSAAGAAAVPAPASVGGVSFVPDDRTGLIVLSGDAGTVERLAQVVRDLDQPVFADTLFRWVPLQDAATVAAVLSKVVPPVVSVNVFAGGVLLSGPGSDVRRVEDLVSVLAEHGQQLRQFYRTQSLDPGECIAVLTGQGAGASAGPAPAVTSMPSVGSVAGGSGAASGSAGPPGTSGGASGTAGVSPASGALVAAGGGIPGSLVPSSPLSAPPAGSVSVGLSSSGNLRVSVVNGGCLIQGPRHEVLDALALLRLVDLPPTRVQVEGALFEVSLDRSQTLGVAGILSKGHLAVGSASQVTTSTPSLMTAVASAATSSASSTAAAGSPVPGLFASVVSGNSGAVLQAIAGVADVKVLSTPTLLVDLGQAARLQVGDQVPVITQENTSNQTGYTTQAVQYMSVGAVLTVTAARREGDYLSLKISQQMSEANQTTTSAINSPTISTRAVDTNVTVRDGQTLFLGGLKGQTVTRNDNGLPVLSSLPGLGWLFGQQSRDNQSSEMGLLLTVRILDDAALARRVEQVVSALHEGEHT